MTAEQQRPAQQHPVLPSSFAALHEVRHPQHSTTGLPEPVSLAPLPSELKPFALPSLEPSVQPPPYLVRVLEFRRAAAERVPLLALATALWLQVCVATLREPPRHRSALALRKSCPALQRVSD